jgi:peptide/nickel transport system permease protein
VIQPVMLVTDFLFFLLLFLGIVFALRMRKVKQFRHSWQLLLRNPVGLVSLAILCLYLLIGIFDCLHFRSALPTVDSGKVYYSSKVESVLDVLLEPVANHQEKTYSEPFATHLFSKETMTLDNGAVIRDYPPLQYINISEKDYWPTFFSRLFQAFLTAFIIWLTICSLCVIFLAHAYKQKKTFLIQRIWSGQTEISWRTLFVFFAIVIFLISFCSYFYTHYHIFGTDKVGNDVFYFALKSVRTGLLIGTLTTLIMLPFALLLGTMAGYYGGIIDDVIQYLYTTLSSIPGVLLVAASILSIQIYVDNHPNSFQTFASRADIRLLALCFILGITSWTSLCRVLRAETLKLREMDYVAASTALGTKNFAIIKRHIIPNVMHLVIIAIVLDFSALVLAEAVLTYVGVGVDPTMFSWGNMIDMARLELARDPLVWWPLAAAFILMFILVLAANLFVDALREAFDPRLVENGGH